MPGSQQADDQDPGRDGLHRGFTLTAGENGWWSITKEGVETALSVRGEERARYAATQLRNGEMIEGETLPEGFLTTTE